MKLSKKGYEKLFEFFMSGKYFDATKCDQIDFEPNDFQGVLVLTIEEAKLIQKLLRHCYFSTDLQEVEELTVAQDWILKERIKQAEMSKQSTSEG